jgi:cystathionine beta-lyase/cystathionine gamma-synthase
VISLNQNNFFRDYLILFYFFSEQEVTGKGLEGKYDCNLLRLSVGLEDVEDIIWDLNQSINKMNA